MKRKLLGVFGLILLVSLFSFSLVSAGWFGETWGKITGNVISSSDCSVDWEGEVWEGRHNVLGFKDVSPVSKRFLCC